MLIKAYGLEFTRLCKADLELVRKWRNSEKINRYMHYKKHITEKNQQKWFAGINNNLNYYFIIKKDQSKIGMVKLNDIDYDKMISETGIFIWDDSSLGKGIPVLAMFMILDFAYYFLGLKKVYGPVLKNNQRAINYYLKLGAVIQGNYDEEMLMIEGTKAGYESKSDHLKEQMKSLYNNNNIIRIFIEKDDFNSQQATHLQTIYNSLPAKNRSRFVLHDYKK